MSWEVFDLINCIISSYLYIWLAAFDESESSIFGYMTIFFESCFTLSVLKRFITDYTPEGEHSPVRELNKISKRYINSSRFVINLVTLMPF